MKGRSIFKHLLVAGCVLVFGNAARAAGKVLVVKPTLGPGITHTSISGAVAAATDGDAILVKSGTYNWFMVDAKSLTIVADTGASVIVTGSDYSPVPGFIISNLAATQNVVVRGIKFHCHSGAGGHLINNLGQVWIDSCELDAQYFGCLYASTAAEGLRVENCSNVVISHSMLKGASPIQSCTGIGCPTGGSQPGLRSIQSFVYFHESKAVGGFGYSACGAFNYASDGGTAVVMTDGFLFLGKSVLQGGSGGSIYPLSPFDCLVNAAKGGDGLRLFGTSPSAYAFDSQLLPGVSIPNHSLCVAFPGLPVTVFAGTFQVLPGTSPTFSGPGVLREGTIGQYQVQGTPQQLAAIAITSDPLPIFASIANGVVYVGYSFTDMQFAQISMTGIARFGVQAPVLPASVFGRQVWVQGATIVPFTNQVTLAAPSPLLLLDASL